MQRLVIVGYVAGALVLQAGITLLNAVLPGPGGEYGAPLPVGHSGGIGGGAISLGGSRSSFDVLPFIVNVLVTAVPITVVDYANGMLSAWAAVVGALLGLALQAALYAQLSTGATAAGLPLPIATHTDLHVNGLALWLDCLFFGVALAFVASALRSMFARRR